MSAVYTCELCGIGIRDGGSVACDDCHRDRLDKLLASAVWRENAATRRGDIEGESLLATIARERAALTGLGGADGARKRLQQGNR